MKILNYRAHIVMAWVLLNMIVCRSSSASDILSLDREKQNSVQVIKPKVLINENDQESLSEISLSPKWALWLGIGLPEWSVYLKNDLETEEGWYNQSGYSLSGGAQASWLLNRQYGFKVSMGLESMLAEGVAGQNMCDDFSSSDCSTRILGWITELKPWMSFRDHQWLISLGPGFLWPLLSESTALKKIASRPVPALQTELERRWIRMDQTYFGLIQYRRFADQNYVRFQEWTIRIGFMF